MREEVKKVIRDIKCFRIRWWNLKVEKVQMFREKMLKEATWDLEEETNILWNKMDECVQMIAKGILKESRGKGLFCKDT